MGNYGLGLGEVCPCSERGSRKWEDDWEGGYGPLAFSSSASWHTCAGHTRELCATWYTCTGHTENLKCFVGPGIPVPAAPEICVRPGIPVPATLRALWCETWHTCAGHMRPEEIYSSPLHGQGFDLPVIVNGLINYYLLQNEINFDCHQFTITPNNYLHMSILGEMNHSSNITPRRRASRTSSTALVISISCFLNREL